MDKTLESFKARSEVVDPSKIKLAAGWLSDISACCSFVDAWPGQLRSKRRRPTTVLQILANHNEECQVRLYYDGLEANIIVLCTCMTSTCQLVSIKIVTCGPLRREEASSPVPTKILASVHNNTI